jgi:hypothetical protein
LKIIKITDKKTKTTKTTKKKIIWTIINPFAEHRTIGSININTTSGTIALPFAFCLLPFAFCLLPFLAIVENNSSYVEQRSLLCDASHRHKFISVHMQYTRGLFLIEHLLFICKRKINSNSQSKNKNTS